MDFADVLNGRRMVRSYRPDPVDEDALRRIVKIVQRAPSAGFSQGHRLIVIRDARARRRLADIAEPAYFDLGMPPWISVAPVLIALCVREASYHERYTEPDKLNEDGTEMDWPVPYWWFDSGSLLVMLQLAAANEGLATGFFGPHAEPEMRAELGLPDDIGLAGFITLGHAAPESSDQSSRRTKRRIALDDLVSWR